jgi:pSer/pThr/pTyr-binding forkhead associated (FHA) protein
MVNLMVYQSGTYRVHELVRDVTMIGRASSNHIVIDDPVVSAQHAIVLKVGDFYRLKDLNSTNGTQINGTFVTDADLKDSDEIRFGSVKAVFATFCRKAWPKPFRAMLQTSRLCSEQRLISAVGVGVEETVQQTARAKIKRGP